ncbi:MAG: DUF3179 domain-containing protein [Acidobacteria bacterium]|nr:DUF3179 domain-containing protein [Acidobacteriota bacterium]
MIPTIDGKAHHFVVGGLYDGVFVAQDTETGTLWNHVTGEALHGPLVGRRLQVLNLLQVNVEQALAVDPETRVAISGQPFVSGTRRSRLSDPKADLNDRFLSTMGSEDTRRPRMELGLGVWTGATHRFYPLERIRQRGEAFVDELDGRKLLVYIDPDASTPAAFFVTASGAKVQGGEIRLDNGDVVRSGVRLDRTGRRRNAEHPQQLFTRWYGFALMFPGCEVFGG